jgi:hemerythrin-like metal-binding protein
MRDVGFPYMETHCAAHRTFLAQIESWLRTLAQAEDKAPIAHQVADVTEDWFVRHIMGADQPLTRFLVERQAGP